MGRLTCTNLQPSYQKNQRHKGAAALLLGAAVFWLENSCFALGSLVSGHAGTFGGGLARTWNNAADAVGGVSGQGMEKLAGESAGNSLFLWILLLAVMALSYLVIRPGRKWAVGVFVLLAFLPPLCLGLRPSAAALCFLFGAAGLALLSENPEGIRRQGIWFTAGAAALLAALFLLPGSSGLLQKPAALTQLRQNAVAALRDAYYGVSPLGDGNMAERRRDTGSGVALTVTMTEPQSLYLRGFVGEVFNGKSWSTLSPGLQYESQNLFYWLREDGFSPLGQLGQSAGLTLPDTQSNEVPVRADTADRRCAYVPYEIGIEGVGRGRNLTGSTVKSTALRRLDRYSYSVGGSAVKNWTTVASEVFIKDSPALSAYLTDESYYNEFVYGHYTYISRQTRDLLTAAVGSEGDQSRGHIGYKAAIEKIKTYFSENFIYTENRGAAADSSNALQDFLSSGKGYDVQYATAAAMMFRYYGIPARYVEGYLITPQMAGKTVEVPRSMAHAWVEIYVDGVGFVPIEVCPPYEGVMEEADLSIGISNESVRSSFGETGTDNSSQENVPDQGGDSNRSWAKIIRVIVAAVLSLLAVFLLAELLLRLFRRLRETYRRQYLFRKGDPKTAVSAIYGYMLCQRLPVTGPAAELGNRAAYSPYAVTETERSELLQQLQAELKERRRRHGKKKNRH